MSDMLSWLVLAEILPFLHAQLAKDRHAAIHLNICVVGHAIQELVPHRAPQEVGVAVALSQLLKDISHRLPIQSSHLHALKEGQVVPRDGRAPESDIWPQVLEVAVEGEVGGLHGHHVGTGAVAAQEASGIQGGEVGVQLDLESDGVHTTSSCPMKSQEAEDTPEEGGMESLSQHASTKLRAHKLL